MISQSLAAFVARCSFDSLPDDVVELAKQGLLDWLGSAVRGSVEPPARIFNEVARKEGGNPRASALPDCWRTCASWAAQINGAASRAVEMDDLPPTSVLHPAAPIISAAVAVAESLNASGREL